MLIHEYQAKKIFEKFQINVPKSVVVRDITKVKSACNEIAGNMWVVKAQIHAGGRGKSGGVVLCDSIEKVEDACKKILNSRLVTNQTTAKGLPVNQVLIESAQSIKRELYLSILVERQTQKIVILASNEGGVDIEEVASKTPDKIIKFYIDPLDKLKKTDCSLIAKKLNITSEEFVNVLLKLYEIFIQKDAILIEINPIIITKDNQILVLDGKIEFDDNAIYRQEEIKGLIDLSQQQEKEILANKHKLSYIDLNGSIGCMVNGAGLAMATMDIIEYYNGSPANFLDVGGGTTSDNVAIAFELIQSKENIKGIFINIFGGIVRCDLIASGILKAIEKTRLTIPIVVRLEGTNAKSGLDLLSKSGFNINTEIDLTKTVLKIIELTK